MVLGWSEAGVGLVQGLTLRVCVSAGLPGAGPVVQTMARSGIFFSCPQLLIREAVSFRTLLSGAVVIQIKKSWPCYTLQ